MKATKIVVKDGSDEHIVTMYVTGPQARFWTNMLARLAPAEEGTGADAELTTVEIEEVPR